MRVKPRRSQSIPENVTARVGEQGRDIDDYKNGNSGVVAYGIVHDSQRLVGPEAAIRRCGKRADDAISRRRRGRPPERGPVGGLGRGGNA